MYNIRNYSIILYLENCYKCKNNTILKHNKLKYNLTISYVHF